RRLYPCHRGGLRQPPGRPGAGLPDHDPGSHAGEPHPGRRREPPAPGTVRGLLTVATAATVTTHSHRRTPPALGGAPARPGSRAGIAAPLLSVCHDGDGAGEAFL